MQANLGTLLGLWRTGRNLSLKRLARESGVSQPTLSRWEAGKNLPRLPELEAVLQALEATPEQRQQALACLSVPRAVQHLRQETSLIKGSPALPPPSAGGLLRAMRLRQRRTLEDVARQIGTQYGSLARWERGETWPDAEKLHTLCFALKAHEAEVAALTCGPGLASAGLVTTDTSLDALTEQLNHLHHLPTLHPAYPLKDLLFLRLEAQIWPRLSESHYVRLLRSVYAAHALYLNGSERYQEALPYVEFALQEGIWDRSQPWWMYAAITNAQCEVFGGKRVAPQRGLEVLKTWQPLVTRQEFAAWIRSEQAGYTFLAGGCERALDLSEQACQMAEYVENPLEYAVRLRSRARLLIKANQPQEVLRLLAGTQAEEVIHRTSVALLRTEALLQLHQKHQAQEELGTAKNLIDTYQIERFQERANTLALRCS